MNNMNPTHYYCDYQNGTQIKNKLQGEFDGFLRFLDGHIYQAEDIPLLKEYVDNLVKTLNEKYPRCKPLKVTLEKGWWNDRSYAIGTEFGILKIKGGEIHRM